MKALIVNTNQKLILTEIEKQKPKKDEVLVKTHSIGINRADILQKQGIYPPPKGASEILGIELSGTVVECGENVDINLIGKNTCALVTGGAYAEYVVVNINCLIFLPENISLTEAAAIPEAYLVSYLNLFYEAKLETNELVYINAGASGVGIAAIQLALANGNQVITSAGSDEKIEFLKNLGVELAINYKRGFKTSHFVNQVGSCSLA
jgi:NADPH:quinone reductase-like Zn-dependent oxidoreductase